MAAKTVTFKLDFIGIGAPKCATTWLAQCLREHPDVCFPKGIKEMHFFNKRHIAFGQLENTSYETNGFEWFTKKFKHCKVDAKKGEFSVSYLTCETACERIKKHFPEVKILVCVRNPINRAYSAYLHGVRYNDFTKKTTFEAALRQEPYLLEKGLYAKNLKKYMKNFKQVKIIFAEDIRKEPEKVFADVCRFLEVNEKFLPPSLTSKQVNKGGTVKFAAINWVIGKGNKFARKYKLNFILKIARWTNIDTILETIRWHNVKPTDKREMNPKTREFLQKYYAKDIKELEKIAKRKLQWQ